MKLKEFVKLEKLLLEYGKEFHFGDKDVEALAIKKAIQKVLIDTPITEIKGGIANNNGYHKFETKNSYRIKNGRC